MTISMDVFSAMYETIANKLLDKNQVGGPWFNGSEEEFEDWAGDVLYDVLEYCLNYFGITVEEE